MYKNCVLFAHEDVDMHKDCVLFAHDGGVMLCVGRRSRA